VGSSRRREARKEAQERRTTVGVRSEVQRMSEGEGQEEEGAWETLI